MKPLNGWRCLLLMLCAFVGLGLEALPAFVIEPLLYGAPMNAWNTAQNIGHWVITCLIWGAVALAIVQTAKRRYGVDLFAKQPKLSALQWVLAAMCVLVSLVISYVDWNGSKIFKEFAYNGALKFAFQYLYYLFETALVALIVVFGQQAFEKWLGHEQIPYGGIVAALTWGLAHILTKGSLGAGLICAVSGFLYGAAYLLVNRDLRKTYWLLAAMLIL